MINNLPQFSQQDRKERVITVNLKGHAIGSAPKIEAHERGILHRAFSIFIFSEAHEMLLQLRAQNKYHSGGLWTNACCGHPRPGEESSVASVRRLKEEMGIECQLTEIFSFPYQVPVNNGLVENEFDTVYLGQLQKGSSIAIDQSEASACKCMPVREIRQWLEKMPETFTPWFRIAFPRVVATYGMLHCVRFE